MNEPETQMETSDSHSSVVEAPQAFTLSIALGNAAMTTGDDVAEVMDEVRRAVVGLGDLARAGFSGIVRDANGNTVGHWEVS